MIPGAYIALFFCLRMKTINRKERKEFYAEIAGKTVILLCGLCKKLCVLCGYRKSISFTSNSI
jgi:hypothetical protein